jgi:hypothetical protein
MFKPRSMRPSPPTPPLARTCSRVLLTSSRSRPRVPGPTQIPIQRPALSVPEESPKFLIKQALELEAGGMYLTLRWSAIHRRGRFSKAWHTRRHARQQRVKRERPWSRADLRCADRCASPARARGRAP